MAICIMHQDLDSVCPCSPNYRFGLNIQSALINNAISLRDFYDFLKETKNIELNFLSEYMDISMNKVNEKTFVHIANKLEEKNIDFQKLLKDYNNAKKEHVFPEIVDVKNLTKGTEYLAYGISHGDGHLSDIDFKTWRRVRFTGLQFEVIEKEDSSRGHFKILNVFELPDMINT